MSSNSTATTTTIHHPPASPSPRMPHVFVIPPEEEQQDNPPWCCFDADDLPDDNSGCTSGSPVHPDVHLFDVPYPDPEPEPELPELDALVFRVGTVDETSPKMFVSRKLEKRQRPDMVRILERDDAEEVHKSALDDSDVIEVVKVKRCKDAPRAPKENVKPKRAKTFRACATKALQSIRNAGLGSRKRHVKDLWTSSESVPGVFKGMQDQIRQQQEQLQKPGASSQPFPSRSRPLSQIFRAAKPSRPAPRCSMDPFPSPPPPSTTSSLTNLKNSETTPSVNDTLSPCSAEQILDRPASPSPSVKKNHRRFSVKELHKVFTFSSPLPDEPLPPSPTTPFPPLRSMSVPSTSTSTVSSDYPDVPVDGPYSAVHFFDLDHADQKLTLPRHPQVTVDDDDDDYGVPLSRHQRHMSVEMRLDSLHFDSLSFDPEDFNVSMTRFVRR